MFLMDEQTVGLNIRRRRVEAGVTLTQLAQRAELAKGTLSKIETGQVSTPISTLIRIADGLGVRVAEFFQEQTAEPAYVLTRAGHAPVSMQNGSKFGYAYQALAPAMRHKHAEPFLLTIKPGDPAGEFRHGGQEFIYLLAGRLRFTVGRDELVLRKGDSLYFDPAQVHKTQVIGKTPARFICVFIHDPTRAPDNRTHA